MKRSTIAGLIAIAICLLLAIPVAMASPPSNLAAKPTTTTAAPTTTSTTVPPTPVQVLGVPHVVSDTAFRPSPTFPPFFEIISCPEGEVALSFAYSNLSGDGNPLDTGVDISYQVIETDGKPTGYKYQPDYNESSTVSVTCSPLVSVVSAS